MKTWLEPPSFQGWEKRQGPNLGMLLSVHLHFQNPCFLGRFLASIISRSWEHHVTGSGCPARWSSHHLPEAPIPGCLNSALRLLGIVLAGCQVKDRPFPTAGPVPQRTTWGSVVSWRVCMDLHVQRVLERAVITIEKQGFPENTPQM